MTQFHESRLNQTQSEWNASLLAMDQSDIKPFLLPWRKLTLGHRNKMGNFLLKGEELEKGYDNLHKMKNNIYDKASLTFLKNNKYPNNRNNPGRHLFISHQSNSVYLLLIKL